MLRAELAKHADAPNPVASFFFWNRTRREVSLIPYGLLRTIPTVHSPFLDHDLYDLMTSLPLDLCRGQSVAHADNSRVLSKVRAHSFCRPTGGRGAICVCDEAARVALRTRTRSLGLPTCTSFGSFGQATASHRHVFGQFTELARRSTLRMDVRSAGVSAPVGRPGRPLSLLGNGRGSFKRGFLRVSKVLKSFVQHIVESLGAKATDHCRQTNCLPR